MQRHACTAVSVQRACARCYAPCVAQNQRTIAMRVSLPAIAVILGCALAPALAPATAQTVIDVPTQKPASPPAQDAVQPQSPAPAPAQSPAQTQVRPQESPLPAPTSRYSFNRVENGFLRLDSESGEVAYCTAQASGWACQTVAINRAPIDREIARLRDEISSLKKEVATLREPPPPRPPADLTPPAEGKKDAEVMIKLPTHDDIARAREITREFVGDAWRRLVEMLTTVQKDIMRRG